MYFLCTHFLCTFLRWKFHNQNNKKWNCCTQCIWKCAVFLKYVLWTCWQVSCGAVHRRTLWPQAAKNDGSGVQRCFPRQASNRAAGTRSRTTAVTNPAQGQDHPQGREASLENPAMSLILQCSPKPCNLAFSYSTRNWILMRHLAKRTYGKEISRESSSSGIQSMRCPKSSECYYRLVWLFDLIPVALFDYNCNFFMNVSVYRNGTSTTASSRIRHCIMPRRMKYRRKTLGRWITEALF